MAKIRGPYKGEFSKAQFRDARPIGHGCSVRGGGHVNVSWFLNSNGKRIDVELSIDEANTLRGLLADLIARVEAMASEDGDDS